MTAAVQRPLSPMPTNGQDPFAPIKQRCVKTVVDCVSRFIDKGFTQEEPARNYRALRFSYIKDNKPEVRYVNCDKIISSLDMSTVPLQIQKIKSDPARAACFTYLFEKAVGELLPCAFTPILDIENISDIHSSSLILKAVVTTMSGLEARADVLFKNRAIWK